MNKAEEVFDKAEDELGEAKKVFAKTCSAYLAERKRLKK
tara:strand:+ start:115 stop:231 length:117 start_codon:yes stop_codon:yes gene_type:complete